MSERMSIHHDLHPEEKITTKFHPSRWNYFWLYFFGIILSVVVVGIIMLIYAEVVRKANKYYITNKKVIHEYKLFSRRVESALYSKIQHVNLEQSFRERILGIGTIEIDTAGGDKVEMALEGISDPHTVKRMIESHMHHPSNNT